MTEGAYQGFEPKHGLGPTIEAYTMELMREAGELRPDRPSSWHTWDAEELLAHLHHYMARLDCLISRGTEDSGSLRELASGLGVGAAMLMDSTFGLGVHGWDHDEAPMFHTFAWWERER